MSVLSQAAEAFPVCDYAERQGGVGDCGADEGVEWVCGVGMDGCPRSTSAAFIVSCYPASANYQTPLHPSGDGYWRDNGVRGRCQEDGLQDEENKIFYEVLMEWGRAAYPPPTWQPVPSNPLENNNNK